MRGTRLTILIVFTLTALSAIALVVFTPLFDETAKTTTPTALTTTPTAENSAGAGTTDKPTVIPSWDAMQPVAEHFEMLTERAFDDQPADLLLLADRARLSFDEVRGALPKATTSEIDTLILEIRNSIETDSRPDVAISAVEGYRRVIEISDASDVSKAISMLDYAGFRIQADLKCDPVRWDDISGAFDFASSQWLEVARHIQDGELADKFRVNLDALGTAIAGFNQDLAESAVVHELDLVDELESAAGKG
jgi:hypothetical protein